MYRYVLTSCTGATGARNAMAASSVYNSQLMTSQKGYSTRNADMCRSSMPVYTCCRGNSPTKSLLGP